MELLKVRVQAIYHQLDNVFTDREAWGLFRGAVLAETIGWTLLITGIIFQKLALPAHEYVLPVAGSLHGLFVVYYVFIVFFVHRSLGWSIWRCLVGEVVNAVPYGTLAFEQWCLRKASPKNET